jgi:hypothetical protein
MLLARVAGMESCTVFRYVFILLLLASAQIETVQAVPAFLVPVKGDTLAEEIKCYIIPYGAIGFVSHLLTYWTLAWLFVGRQPFMPRRRLRNPVCGAIVGILAFLLATIFAIFTVVRCRNRWQFVLIVFWKLTLTVTVAGTTSCAPYLVDLSTVTSSRETSWPSGKEVWKNLWGWLIAFIVGLIIGMVGLISLVAETWDNRSVRIITYTFLAACLTAVGVRIIMGCRVGWNQPDGDLNRPARFAAVALAYCVLSLSLLYSDWILGAVAGNLARVPSSDIAWLYWAYFISERLPLLSI